MYVALASGAASSEKENFIESPTDVRRPECGHFRVRTLRAEQANAQVLYISQGIMIIMDF